MLIATLVAQQKRRGVELRDDKVGAAVSCYISDGDRARLRELDAIQMKVARHILPTRGAKISQQPHFSAGFGFAQGYEVEPAVVIVVEHGKSPAALPVQLWQGDTLEALAFDVAP